MEHEDGFSGYPNKITRTTFTIHPRHSSTAATTINAAVNVNDDHLNEQQQVPQPPLSTPAPASALVIREQDQYMPIANVIRIMRRILPPHAKISDDAKETVQECVSEFISFVTGEANERCHREQRKTITAEDVIWAMGKLGFDNYVDPLSLFLSRYRESESERSSSHKEPIFRHSIVDYGPVGVSGAYGPVFNIIPRAQQGFYDPSMGGYFRDGSDYGAGSSSQANLPDFDPFVPFK